MDQKCTKPKRPRESSFPPPPGFPLQSGVTTTSPPSVERSLVRRTAPVCAHVGQGLGTKKLMRFKQTSKADIEVCILCCTQYNPFWSLFCCSSRNRTIQAKVLARDIRTFPCSRAKVAEDHKRRHDVGTAPILVWILDVLTNSIVSDQAPTPRNGILSKRKH